MNLSATSAMEVRTPLRAIRRIKLDGEYDLSQKEELESIFASLAADGPVTIDLTSVTYVDSTFLQALAMLHCRLKGHVITLEGANSAVRRILNIVQFDKLFRITES